jgi:cytochrome b561
MQEYSAGSKWFHWITVALLALAWPVGFVIGYLKDDAKTAFYTVHESAGLIILAVVLVRLAWRLRHPPPPLPSQVPPLLRGASAGVHHTLYALLILQPVIGFIATNAWGFPLRGDSAFLGFIDLPKFMETNEALAGVVQTAHTIGGYAILVLLLLHIGGVVFHQAVRRDGILQRMVGGPA